MAKQILKGTTMLMLIVGLALAAAVVANGQAQPALRAQVPFDFVVGEKTLRAGEYRVSQTGSTGEAVVINSDKGDRILCLSNNADRFGDRELAAKLVFHRYNNTYFLSQVWMAGDSTGRELPKTKQERGIERELKAIAANHDNGKPLYEVVEVLATVR
jgi:hypothetical protein